MTLGVSPDSCQELGLGVGQEAERGVKGWWGGGRKCAPSSEGLWGMPKQRRILEQPDLAGKSGAEGPQETGTLLNMALSYFPG